VGVARHAGIASFLSGVGETESIWIANTDADSVVPSTWLLDQIRVAETGADVVVGTVRLADETGRVGRNFSAAYAAGLRSRGGHSHVHGANVGFRAGAYLEVGGFPPLAVHEDRSLLRRLEAAGAVIARSSRLRVETSGRLVGRCTGGFASSLLQLASTD
jgi:cellulose synthase/poly-beta-1,6-N-acetylglucosamine synthase-like glycosyltransferase